MADPNFVLKALEGRADEINTCIGCNQVLILPALFVLFCCALVVVNERNMSGVS